MYAFMQAMRELEDRIFDITGLFEGTEEFLDCLPADLAHPSPRGPHRRAASCGMPQRSSADEDDIIIQVRADVMPSVQGHTEAVCCTGRSCVQSCVQSSTVLLMLVGVFRVGRHNAHAVYTSPHHVDTQ